MESDLNSLKHDLDSLTRKEEEELIYQGKKEKEGGQLDQGRTYRSKNNSPKPPRCRISGTWEAERKARAPQKSCMSARERCVSMATAVVSWPMLNKHLRGKPRFVAFARFSGVNTPTMADFKLSEAELGRNTYSWHS